VSWFFFFSSRRRHTRCLSDWSSDVCSSDLGDFPAWLAPEQVRLVPISDKVNDYARALFTRLKNEGIRASLDEHSDKLGAKIRRRSEERRVGKEYRSRREADQ